VAIISIPLALRRAATSTMHPASARQRWQQRHIIKEKVKVMAVPKAPANAPETVGDVVPRDINYPNCHPWPGKKWRRRDPICSS